MTKRILGVLVVFLALSGRASAQSCDPSNYTGMTATTLIPSNFCPFLEAPWRNPLPANPTEIDLAATENLHEIYDYLETLYPYPSALPGANTVMGVIGQMPALDGFGGCSGGVTYCHGDSGYSTWIVTDTNNTNNPRVTVACASTFYGCSNELTSEYPASSLPQFRIPRNYRPSCDGTGFCDRNGTIIQPDGKAISMYGCWPTRNFVDGDVLGNASGPCNNGVNGVNYTDIQTGRGINPGNVNGGDDFVAVPVKWHEIESGQITHALSAHFRCGTGTVYPGAGAGTCADLGLPLDGIPWGSRIWLALNHTQIDNLINTNVEPEAMRPFLYAMHDYGIYILDGGDPIGLGQPFLENTTQLVINGGTNPWVDWIINNGGGLAADGQYKLADANTIDFRPLADDLYVLDPCYADDSCPDSGVTPEPATGTTTTSDTFTGSAGTTLTAHTGELGATWTTATGSTNNLVISDAGRIRNNAGSVDTITLASGPPLSGEYDIHVDVKVKSIPSAGNFYGIWFRALGTEKTGLQLEYDASAQDWKVWRYDNGLGYEYASYSMTFVDEQDVEIDIRVRADTGEIGVFIDGVRRLHNQNQTLPTGTYAGIGIYAGAGADSNTTGLHFDNFEVIDVDTAQSMVSSGRPPRVLRLR